VSFTPDLQKGMVVGEVGFGLTTTDRGASWIPMNLATTATLRDVAVLNADIAIAVGNANVIRRTTDGGFNWSVVTPPVTATWLDISFLNTTHGFISGSGGNIIFTTDGGETWNTTPPVNSSTYSIQMLDANTIVGATALGTFMKSTDGGATWSQSTIDSGEAPLILSVGFFDATEGFVGDIDGRVYRTTDGGASWTEPEQITGGGWLYRASIADGNTAIVSGMDGYVYTTTDRGLTWNASSSGSNATLIGIEAHGLHRERYTRCRSDVQRGHASGDRVRKVQAGHG
jgi:photosystem II stability/assembly factor-like uncharacterized protein